MSLSEMEVLVLAVGGLGWMWLMSAVLRLK